MKMPNLAPLFLVAAAAVAALCIAYAGDARAARSPAAAEPVPAPAATRAPIALQAVEAEPGGGRQAAAVEAQNSAAAASPSCAEEIQRLEGELDHARRTVAELQHLLKLARFQVVMAEGTGQGTFGQWVASLLPEERPATGVMFQIAERLEDFEGLRLQAHEGLWLAERIQRDDWPEGEDQTAAFIRYLGPERVVRELDAGLLDEFRSAYAEDGVFAR